MVHCFQNNNLASILFDAKKNTFLHFRNLFSKSKNKKQTWITVNMLA